MALSRLPITAIAISTLVATAAAPVHAQTIQRAMYVSAVDNDGKPVPDLGPADFIVREDGVAREVLRVEPAAEPMQMVILVDNSTAANPYIADMRRGLERFVVTMATAPGIRGKNEISIVLLASRPTTVTKPTSSLVELRKGVGRIFAEQQSGAVLLDGILEASQALRKSEAARPAIVVVATEGPQASWKYRDQVLGPLRDSGAVLHAIVVGPFRDSLSEEDRDRNFVLEVGTNDTGGRLEHPLASTAVDIRLQALADELLHQYRVTYARPQSLIPPEKVTVSTERPGVKARGTLIKEPRQVRP